MKHTILILLMCICSNIAAHITYQLPADTRRVNVEMKCGSCGKYYTVSRLYSEQIDTYFTNDFEPCYCDNFMCSSCREDKNLESLIYGIVFAIILFAGCMWLLYNLCVQIK